MFSQLDTNPSNREFYQVFCEFSILLYIQNVIFFLCLDDNSSLMAPSKRVLEQIGIALGNTLRQNHKYGQTEFRHHNNLLRMSHRCSIASIFLEAVFFPHL